MLVLDCVENSSTELKAAGEDERELEEDTMVLCIALEEELCCLLFGLCRRSLLICCCCCCTGVGGIGGEKRIFGVAL
jgi:hypothetical protein